MLEHGQEKRGIWIAIFKGVLGGMMGMNQNWMPHHTLQISVLGGQQFLEAS
jgi:hypothetical protein